MIARAVLGWATSVVAVSGLALGACAPAAAGPYAGGFDRPPSPEEMERAVRGAIAYDQSFPSAPPFADLIDYKVMKCERAQGPDRDRSQICDVCIRRYYVSPVQRIEFATDHVRDAGMVDRKYLKIGLFAATSHDAPRSPPTSPQGVWTTEPVMSFGYAGDVRRDTYEFANDSFVTRLGLRLDTSRGTFNRYLDQSGALVSPAAFVLRLRQNPAAVDTLVGAC